jgi:chemotaxis protein MotB
LAAERRRRNQDTKKENNERWVISYADFMTLLLATFVVLYAVSSINVSRYRAAAEALSAVFTGKVIVPDRGSGANPNGLFQNQPAPVPKPIVRLDLPQKGKPDSTVKSTEMQKGVANVSEKIRERIAKLDEAYKNLTHLLQDVIDKGEVQIAHNGLSVVIDINANVLFDSGKADLTTSALGVIDQIGVVLKDQPYSIQVNGYTDDAPIHTTQFSSNWELSAMRAISVVRRFVNDGVDPSRLVGAGYGEYHPVASNDDTDGKTKNRRVSVVVVSADDSKQATPGSSGAAEQTTMSDRAGIPHPLPDGSGEHPVSLASPGPVKSAPAAPAVPFKSVLPAPSVPVKSAPLAPAAPVKPVLNQTQWPFTPVQPH